MKRLYQNGDVQWFYDYQAAMWVVRTVDRKGTQIGEANYVETKQGRDNYIRHRGQTPGKPKKVWI